MGEDPNGGAIWVYHTLLILFPAWYVLPVGSVPGGSQRTERQLQQSDRLLTSDMPRSTASRIMAAVFLLSLTLILGATGSATSNASTRVPLPSTEQAVAFSVTSSLFRLNACTRSPGETHALSLFPCNSSVPRADQRGHGRMFVVLWRVLPLTHLHVYKVDHLHPR